MRVLATSSADFAESFLDSAITSCNHEHIKSTSQNVREKLIELEDEEIEVARAI